ncbi:MAG TPA: methenyltetrahydromethanopterin cyclohydrolase, partial [Gemmatimonadaceae bacterium]|nr:methenyltetrahydromethanopterin cyclohydrolase [Gemmatimonadaceae bacterium]
MASDVMSAMGLNERAWAIADNLAARAAELRIAVSTLPSGARVLDAGIEVRGGYGAGVGLAELCMGGLGYVSFNELEIGGTPYPGVQVYTDHPAVAHMASQYAG